MDSSNPSPRRLRTEAAPEPLEGLRPLRAHGDPRAENLLVHGDNLRGLGALEALGHRGRFRCAYLDPPYNTGRTFAEYDDALGADAWIAMMRPRLDAVRRLLADDGAVAVEIDDTQLGPLLVLMDEVFGKENRVSTITVVRSAPTGHKAQNAGPVHVSDFLLLYAKDRKRWRYRPQVRVRDGVDRAYGTWLDNPADPPAAWRFRPLRAVVAEALGHGSTRDATRALGKEGMDRAVERHALANARHVVRFAQPRYEAIAREAQKIVDRSKKRPHAVLVLERPGLPPFIVRGGNRILFLRDKVRVRDGEPVVVEALTNVWTDVPFQGIAREGGVAFSRNKKPERLVARVLAMTTDPGDWVLDPFLGSGTTAAVAQKLGRRWVGMESGEHAFTLAEPRLVRVVSGEDRTGIRAETGCEGGGFRVVAVR